MPPEVVSEEPESTLAGSRMVEELLAVHRPLRADIVVLGCALEILTDATGDHSAVPEMINGLTIADFVWQLRLNCDYYCNVLTAHHSLEDHRMFPVMLRTFPELASAIERLYAEHADVVDLIRETRSATANLTTEPDTVDRARVAVSVLADHLTAHLDFEESTLFPYFRRMDSDWHYG
ncbi:hemerythrin domain-containing protein [Nocardia sp. NBC_00511]|uniref:hemerythrin domain-containing protein n=1 Tax=Nocardia sp. NBC_00511 TaxID=2903591 RepID=UPI0030E42F1C